MTYDGFLLSAVAAELKQTILRGRVQKIRQSSATDVVIEVRASGRTYVLFISVDARFPRIYLTASTPRPLPEPPNFTMLMRKYASGAFVSSAGQIGMDRILHIGLDSAEHGKLTLICEIMGKHSNLILIDSEGRILGAAKHVGSSISRYRQVLPGRQYIPPPGEPKIDIRDVDAVEKTLRETTWPKSSPDLQQWLTRTFSGFGPFLADEIVARSGGEPDRMRDELLRLGEIVRTGAYQPVLITDERGVGVMVYPMASAQFPADRQHPRDSINEALDTLFRSLVARTTIEEERAALTTSIQRAIASRKQTLKSIARTIEESAKAERYKQMGEIILANLHAIEKGAKSVRLIDFFAADMPEIEIELDEKLDAQANAQRYFKRYRKARDSASTAESRRAVVESEIARLESALEKGETFDKLRMPHATTVESLRELRADLTAAGLLRQEVSITERQEPEFEGHRIRRVTVDDWEILYGENSTSNDYLTQRVARPNDIWLHARQVTGAHVVIRTTGRKGGVPRPVLMNAARIAALNCDARHSSLVAVDYTLRKYVHKPRASAPGFVVYRNEKTIDVNPKEA